VSKTFEEIGTDAGGFGERLRREREMRGVSLDLISASTKIGTRLLRALEDEQFDLLPGGIFNKGYVRAYARHLGIDEEQAVADYLQAAHETPPDVRSIAHQNSSMHSDANRYDIGRPVVGRRFPLVPVLVLLVVIVGAVGGWRLYRQRQRERVQSNLAATQTLAAKQTTGLNQNAGSAAGGAGAATSSAEIAGGSQPVATSKDSGVIHTVEAAESSVHSSGSDGASRESTLTGNAAAQANTPFAVTVRAKDRARVEVKSDGEVVVRGVIEPSEVKTFHASSRLVFWTANAGQVEISFNGKSVPISGGENDERILVFNSRGLVPRPAAQ
jgi:cytoskeleton protein RodZ